LLALLNDIDEKAPCGYDCRYEDIFLSIENEIDKSVSVLEDIQTDWMQIIENSEYLLTHQTKDVKILCWWTYGLWKKESWNGLEKALQVFNALLSKHVDNIFPKSTKVKISSITWLEELLNEELLDQNGNVLAQIDAQVFLDLFVQLEKNLVLALKQELNIFQKIKKPLEQLVQSKIESEKVVETEVAEVASKQSSNEIDSISSDVDATKVLNALRKNATLLQSYWLQKDENYLGAIRLARLLSWLETDGLPVNENGKTPLNAPSQDSLEEIEALYAEKNYEDALKKVESLISFSPFWLDGHYLTYKILSDMGHDQVALEVKNRLIAYVNVNDEILDLTFKDTTPFASMEVKEWLSQSLQNSGKKDESKTSNTTHTKESLLESCYALAKHKKIKEAMNILQNSYSGSTSQEEKFYWRLSHAELAKEFGKNDISLVLLKELMKDIDIYKLDVWKPELSAKVYGLFLSFSRASVDVDEQKSIFSRLCKIDIEQALEIKI
jgi:type VI secretion system protein VasJ